MTRRTTALIAAAAVLVVACSSTSRAPVGSRQPPDENTVPLPLGGDHYDGPVQAPLPAPQVRGEVLAAHVAAPATHVYLLMHMEPWQCATGPFGQAGWIMLTRVGALTSDEAADMQSLLSKLQTLPSGSSLPSPHTPLVSLTTLAFASNGIPSFANGPQSVFPGITQAGCGVAISIINPSDVSVEVEGVGLQVVARSDNPASYGFIDICKGVDINPKGYCSPGSYVSAVEATGGNCALDVGVNVTLDPGDRRSYHLGHPVMSGCSDVLGPHQRRDVFMSASATGSQTYVLRPAVIYRDPSGSYRTTFPTLDHTIAFVSEADRVTCYELAANSLVPEQPTRSPSICV